MGVFDSLTNHRYVSGAEEKVVRAFSAPSTFLDNLARISGAQVTQQERQGAAQGASTPSLGLSNKAVYQGQTETPVEEKHVKDMFPDHYFTPETHEVPPPEETLVQNTLWPEVRERMKNYFFLIDKPGAKSQSKPQIPQTPPQPLTKVLIV